MSGASGEDVSIGSFQVTKPKYLWVDGSQIGGGVAQGDYTMVITP